MSSLQNEFDLRRAAEERAKAVAAPNEKRRQLHLQLADLFEARVRSRR